MYKRPLLVILNAGVFVLLLVLTMEASGIRRSLRRIEHEAEAAQAAGWVLMAPPPPLGNVNAPLAQWTLIAKPFDTEAQCLVARHSLGLLGGGFMPTPVYYNTRCFALVAPGNRRRTRLDRP
jgi:hypothetical protein